MENKILTCDTCKFTEDSWRFKEEFVPKTQLSKFYCPNCKKLVYKEEKKKKE